MNESSYITQMRERFLKKHPSGFFYKIPDANDAQLRPFDGFWVLPQPIGFVAFEAKLHKNMGPWHFNKIEPHQISNLRDIQALGFNTYIVLGVRADTTKFDRKRLPKPLTRVRMDIFIPVPLIPGTGEDIELKTLDIRSLAATLDLKGNRSSEILLQQDRITEFTTKCVDRSREEDRPEQMDLN